MAGKGGSRPGAGRKPKAIKLGLDMHKNAADMIQQKLRLLSKLHDTDIIDTYCEKLSEMLKSSNAGERRDAVKIITDIILKTETPTEVQDNHTKVMTAEILVNKLRKERAENSDKTPKKESTEGSEEV
jgi:hypothetical protein